MKKKYDVLLKDDNVKRWYHNICRGSDITGSIYLRRLGNFCEKHKITPQELIEFDQKRIYDLLLDIVTDMEKKGYAGSYIASVLKAIKSWLIFNDIEIKKNIRIKGIKNTPTLKDERVPTQRELRKIFLAGDLKTKVACSLVAHSGLRIEVLGNYKGNDGLRIKDFPEIEINDGTIEFKKIPTMIIVRPELSKSRKQFFTFLSQEGCEYLKEYLELRIRKEERITKESPVIKPKTARKEFISTINIGDSIRTPIRKAGFSWRPYVLRSYFDTQLMIAESKGLIIRDFRTFFMGHKGDIEATYTLRKRLTSETIEEMRQSYKKAQKFIQTIATEQEEEDIKKMFKKQLLLVAGVKPDEIKEEQLEMGDEEFQEFIKEKFMQQMGNNTIQQRVVEVNDVEKYLTNGWEFVGSLPNNKAILKLPPSS